MNRCEISFIKGGIIRCELEGTECRQEQNTCLAFHCGKCPHIKEGLVKHLKYFSQGLLTREEWMLAAIGDYTKGGGETCLTCSVMVKK